MIRNFIKYFLSILFLFSAIAKLYDYNSTVELFESLLSIDFQIAKVLLFLIILIESICALLIVTESIQKRFLFQAVVGLISVFIITNIFFAIRGFINCGCFGSKIISSPVISIIKNIFLLIGFYYLKYPFQFHKKIAR